MSTVTYQIYRASSLGQTLLEALGDLRRQYEGKLSEDVQVGDSA